MTTLSHMLQTSRVTAGREIGDDERSTVTRIVDIEVQKLKENGRFHFRKINPITVLRLQTPKAEGKL